MMLTYLGGDDEAYASLSDRLTRLANDQRDDYRPPWPCCAARWRTAMSEQPTLTREAWRRLTRSAYGLTALAGTLDDLIGEARGMEDRDKRDRLHGLTGALLSLAQSVEETITELDDAEVWTAPMFVQEEATHD